MSTIKQDRTIKNIPRKSSYYDYFNEQVLNEEKEFIKTLTGMVDPLKEKPVKKINENKQEKTVANLN